MPKKTEALENYYLKAEECEAILRMSKNGAPIIYEQPLMGEARRRLDDNYLTAAQTPAPAAIPKAKAGPA